MLGALRYVLAVLVVLAHLADGTPWLSHAGVFAVFGFYLISGYLITRVLNDVYQFNGWFFWGNRILRLFPQYYVLLACALGLIYLTPHAGEFLPHAWKSTPEPFDWFAVVTIFPLGFFPQGVPFRPVPPIWSVGIELVNYALLWMFVGRKTAWALAAVAASLAYHAYSVFFLGSLDIFAGANWGSRYFPFYAAALPFSIGALIFLIKRRPSSYLSKPLVGVACVTAWLANLAIAGWHGGVRETILFNVCFYVNLGVVALLVYWLSQYQLKSQTLARIDKILGDLSYPVFLSHWLVGYVMALVFFGGQWRGVGFAFTAVPVATLVAYLLSVATDKLVEPTRNRLRALAKTRRTSGVVYA